MKSTLVLLIALALYFFPQNLKNTCKSHLSYFNIHFSNNCYYNPDLDDDILTIIQRHVGTHQTHQVQTDDGYILKLFRLPRENPKGVVLFQHPMGTDARIWVSQYNQSIAFLFWRAGYDVWLGNTRGNYFCKNHTSLKSTEAAFWNFSFHEMGYYDNHAIVGYVRGQTNGFKIIYLGYSMGGTSGMIYASTRDKEAHDSIKMMVLMAPGSHIRLQCTTFLKYILFVPYHLQQTFSIGDPLFVLNKNDAWYMKSLRFFSVHFPCKTCILYFVYLFVGWPQDDLEPDLINMCTRVYSSEFPLKVMYHYYQLYLSDGSFRRYDYGEKGNLVFYGAKEPPWYPLENIKVPVFIVHGQKDIIDCGDAFETLYSTLVKNSRVYGRLVVQGFNHIDFSHGRYRNERVYYKILQLLEDYNLDE